MFIRVNLKPGRLEVAATQTLVRFPGLRVNQGFETRVGGFYLCRCGL
ncbi:hypothetical protein [Nostoc sp.]